jgi:hypothetical protein
MFNINVDANTEPGVQNLEEEKQKVLQEMSKRLRELELHQANSNTGGHQSDLLSVYQPLEAQELKDTNNATKCGISREEDMSVIDPLMQGGKATSAANPYANHAKLPFKDPEQNWILINVAHLEQSPHSRVPQFRLCGAFAHKMINGENMILRHVQEVGGVKAYGNVNLLTTEMHKKFLICTSFKKQMDSEYVQQKIQEVTLAYQQHNQYCKEEFEAKKLQYREEQKKQKEQSSATTTTTNSNGVKDMSKKSTLTKEELQARLNHHKKLGQRGSDARTKLLNQKFDQHKKQGREAGRVSRNAELRCQNFAVVSIIPDMTPAVQAGLEEPEPVVIVWACVDTEDAGKQYIYNTAAEKIEDLSLDIFQMYEWISPTELKSEQVEEGYRNPTLDAIMKTRKKQKTAVSDYEKWFEEQKRQVPVIESTINEFGEQIITKPDAKDTPPPITFEATVAPRMDHGTDISQQLGRFQKVSQVSNDETHLKYDYVQDGLETKSINRNTNAAHLRTQQQQQQQQQPIPAPVTQSTPSTSLPQVHTGDDDKFKVSLPRKFLYPKKK